MNVLTTLREEQSGNKTILEQQGNITLRENQSAQKISGAFSEFRGFTVKKQLPSNSTEADIFIIAYNSINYILKLYRYGIEPKAEILKNVIALGKKYPDKFLQVLQADYDSTTKRWFEIQEYIKLGSFQKILDQLNKFNDEQKNFLFRALAREIGQELYILHSNNLLHLDIKPSNILMRSYKPFNLVLIDFGISTLLASDMSKKFTQTRGTPMYQSPESWAGSMNRASDWWGLGMILLEIVLGKHPFSGLDYKVIASIMATRSVEIPENIDNNQKKILRGLLTRDPDKRWKWEQVSRWLQGEIDTEDSFNELPSAKNRANIRPVKFMGEDCYSLAEFSRFVVESEDSWDKGKGFLMRGYIRQWLEENREFDSSVEIENMLASVNDPDEKLFCLTQNFGRNLPFIFCGHLITLKNLLLFTAKALNREELSESEQKIIDTLDNGVLLSCVETFRKLHDNPSAEFQILKIFLEIYRGDNLSTKTGMLDFCVNPENYYCPFIKDKVSDTSEILKIKISPIKLSEYQEIDKNFFIPEEIINEMKSSITDYYSKLEELRILIASQSLFPKEGYSDKEIKIVRKLLPAIKSEHRTKEFIDFYLYPKKYYCPFIKDVKTMSELISVSQVLTSPPVLLNEWKKLADNYILPANLVEGMLNPADYNSSFSEIKNIHAQEHLLKLSENQAVIKEAAKCKSLEEYITLFYKVTNHYDEESIKIINSAIQDVHDKISSEKDKFTEAQLELWAAYFEALATYELPFSEADKYLIDNINLENTDELYQRMTELKNFMFTEKSE